MRGWNRILIKCVWSGSQLCRVTGDVCLFSLVVLLVTMRAYLRMLSFGVLFVFVLCLVISNYNK
jgi:hypothetical protein